MADALTPRDDEIGHVIGPRGLDAYGPRYADHFALSRTAHGALTVRMHRDGGPAPWSRGLLNAWAQVLADVAQDRHNEVLIVTGTGAAWIDGIDPKSFASPPHTWSADVIWEQYHDGLALLERLVHDVQIPTIGVLNGPGPRQELALMCDITLCADTVTFGDGNFAAGSVPGDGMFLVLSQLIGPKRATAMMYTGTRLDASEALAAGLVTEVLPGDRLTARVAELADAILQKPRAARRMTHAVAARHWQGDVVSRLRETYAQQLLAARP